MEIYPGSGGLQEKLELAYALHAECSRRSLDYYLHNVVINSQPEPRRFGLAADPWQWELLAPKIPALESLAGLRRDYRGPLSFMSVLARGHDKSSLEGRMVTWLLLASRRTIHGYILAADKDQGRLIIQAIQDEAAHNPWVADQLDIQRNTVRGPAGEVEVLPADAASAYGLRGNLFICDELTHWKNQKVWTAVVSGREKVPGAILIVLSNAGLLGTWQHEIRLAVDSDPDWVVFERPGHLASWMDEARLTALRNKLPPSEAERLYDNKWIDPAAEFDYLRRGEVQACADLGRSLGLVSRLRREIGVQNYVVGIDYGSRKDRTAFVVLHLDEDGRTRIDRMDVWQGTPADPVSVTRVEDHVWELERLFSPAAWVVDPYQMAGTIERMQRKGLPVESFNARGGAANYEMAQHLRARIVNRLIAWPPGTGDLDVKGRTESLLDELVALRVKRRPYGFRFDHENQKHDDRAVAIGMADLRAVTLPFTRPVGNARPLQRAVLPEPGRERR